MTQDNNTSQNNKKKDPNKKFPNKNQKPKFNIYWIYGIILLVFLAINFFSTSSNPIKIDQGRFLNELLKPGHVERVVLVNKEFVEVYIKEESLKLEQFNELEEKGFGGIGAAGPHYTFTVASAEAFDQRMAEVQEGVPADNKIYVESDTRREIFTEILSYLLPIILIVALWLFIFRRMSGGSGGPGGAGNIFSVGKSKAKLFDKEATVKVDFSDVAGLDEAKIEVKEIVDFLKNPKKYTNLGGKIPKGALLVGPPGTGKTLLAKAVAGEANVPFFSMSGSDFVEMFVGVGASRVRDLFKQAKEKAPCIVFIDEIDAIGRARGKNPNFGSNDERENTLNQLLTEMDGFSPNQGVIILAATNRADVLDRALLRAGRFDRQIHVELPDINERRQIFEVHLRPIKLAEGFDIEFLAKQTPGFSGADIANVCNEAALIAARKNKDYVERQDFLDAIDRIVGGLEKKNKVITQMEKKTISYHEAGHATISWLLEHANPLVKVTIVPRGRALGAAWYLPEERQITTSEQLLDEMCAALGGRASEQVNFGTISTGALNDLEKVTKQAYAMVSYFGLSEKVGNLSYYDSTGQNDYAFNKPYSEDTAQLIDKESKNIVSSQYERALKILSENKEGLVQLAELLMEKEVIFAEDLERIFGKRNFLTREEQIHKEKKEAAEKKNGVKKENKDNTSEKSTADDEKPSETPDENDQEITDEQETKNKQKGEE
jgi:cell division protease FtsH